MSLLVLLVLTLLAGFPGVGSSESGEGWSECAPTETEPTNGRVFTLVDGEFVTYPPGVAKTGDKIVCAIDGKRIETFVPPPKTGVSVDPMYVGTKPNGAVRAECGGIHAETAPPGSW
jgi:hypothetical protein